MLTAALLLPPESHRDPLSVSGVLSDVHWGGSPHASSPVLAGHGPLLPVLHFRTSLHMCTGVPPRTKRPVSKPFTFTPFDLICFLLYPVRKSKAERRYRRVKNRTHRGIHRETKRTSDQG